MGMQEGDHGTNPIPIPFPLGSGSGPQSSHMKMGIDVSVWHTEPSVLLSTCIVTLAWLSVTRGGPSSRRKEGTGVPKEMRNGNRSRRFSSSGLWGW